jgi:hypothetical protein
VAVFDSSKYVVIRTRFPHWLAFCKKKTAFCVLSSTQTAGSRRHSTKPTIDRINLSNFDTSKNDCHRQRSAQQWDVASFVCLVSLWTTIVEQVFMMNCLLPFLLLLVNDVVDKNVVASLSQMGVKMFALRCAGENRK